MKNPRAIGRLLVAAFTFASSSALLAVPTLPVWVNEIHYDNSGADAGEFVEIAGEAGLDLSGYKIELYNGANNSVYETVSLSGSLDNEGSGFGAVSFDSAGIQNGGPDGLALIDSSGFVIQFLSYEGTFTATGGTADGMTSTDIGVAESTSTPVGYSLQLTGVGSTYFDFTWTGPSAQSPGSINSEQSFVRKSVPDIGSTAWMLILGLSGLALVRRRK